jgi:MFS transporter, DHA1 family, multidrug resistance protein
MWSYVQYRRIGKQVEEEARRKPSRTSDHSSHAEKGFSPIEPGKASLPDALSAPQLEHGRYSTDGEQQGRRNGLTNTPDDRFMVRPFGEDDPLDPRNWSLLSRCKNIAILSLLIFVQGWAGAAGSIANLTASQEFHVGKVAENLSTAMYLFGIGSGSLFVGPLSETVGRNPTYLVATFFYLAFVLGSALTPTFGGQVVCRFLVGLFASATLAINGSSVRDQFRPVKRAFVFPVIAWANVAGKDQLLPFSTAYADFFLSGYSSCHSTCSKRLDSIE